MLIRKQTQPKPCGIDIFIYNASSTLLLELMRFQIIQIEQHLNSYLLWKRELLDLEIQEGDRQPLWHEMPALDSRSFGKAIRRNVVVKSALDIWPPGEESFMNLKLCDWWWGVWLQYSLCERPQISATLPNQEDSGNLELTFSLRYERAAGISMSIQQRLIGLPGLMGHLSHHTEIC